MFYFLTDSLVVAKLYTTYKTFDNALVDARKKLPGETGYIPIGTFSDNTRRIIDIDDEYRDLNTQIFSAIWRLTHLPERFKDSIPRWLGQPNYVEVWIEKDAMTGTIYSILKDSKVRIAPNRGWGSMEFLHINIERLEDQIKKNDGGQFEGIKDIWILYVGDFDPSGLKMDGRYEEALRKLQVRLGGQVHVHFKRIALTWDQITTFKLEHLKNAALSPREREKLDNDPNGPWFEDQYGLRFQIQSDSLQTKLAKFKKLMLDEVNGLFDEGIRKDILALPEHSIPPLKIWEQIKGSWTYEVLEWDEAFYGAYGDKKKK